LVDTSVVKSVAEPTGSGAADYGEDAGGSEQARGGDFGQAMIDAGGDEMGADQSHRRGTTDKVPT
jgi:hypothetical protein